jgi:hypothetical protein
MVVQKNIPYKETELNPCYKKLYSLNDQEKGREKGSVRS